MGLSCSLENPAGLWGLPTQTPTLFFPVDYSPITETFSTTVAEIARSMCPVSTGNLQASISASGGTITVGADYAQYVEYGTWKSPAQPFLTPAVQAGAMMAYQQAQQIYQQAVQVENMLIRMQGMMGAMLSSMGEAEMKMMGEAGMTGGGEWVHPETGMSQATADSILDNYAKEHGISVPQETSMSGSSLLMTGISPSSWAHAFGGGGGDPFGFIWDFFMGNDIKQMGPGWGNGIAKNIGANLGLLVGGEAYFSGAAGNLMSGALGMVVGGLATAFLTVLFDSMAAPTEEFSIAIPEISVI